MSVAEFDHFTWMLIALMAALLSGIGVTLIFRIVVPPVLARLFHADDAEKRYLALLREGYAVRDRVRILQSRVRGLDSEHSSLDAELRKTQRQLVLAASRPPDFIHEVGDPRLGHSKFVARLTIEAGSSMVKPSSELYNPLWHHLNLAEVWAATKEDARQLLAIAYPDKLGYQKMFLEDQQTKPRGSQR